MALCAEQREAPAADAGAVGLVRLRRADAGPWRVSPQWLAVGALLAAALVWSYWPVLTGLWQIWQSDPDYSAGQIVPLIAVYAVWTHRGALSRLPVRANWWGLVVLAGSQAMRVAGVLLNFGSLQHYSLVVAVVGVVLLVFGSRVTRQLGWVLALLLLMAPLPNRISQGLLVPLQNFATTSAVEGLATLGHLVNHRGTVLYLGDGNILWIAEACSGLRMLTAFVIVGAGMAFMFHRRPRWHKAVLMAATVPVAILANSVRLVATVLLFEYAGSEVSETFFHDFAGLVMMPLAVGVLLVLLWAMQRVSEFVGEPER